MFAKKKQSPQWLVLRELTLPFWSRSEHRTQVWVLTLLLFALMGGMVYILILLNRWNQGFYDALQNLNQAEFLRQLQIFFFIALGYGLIVAYKFYILQSLGVRWRQWLTEKSLSQWLSHKNFYLWQVLPNPSDNPDQRLSDDIRELTELSLEIGEKVLRELITFLSFIGILWALSTNLHFEVSGYQIEIQKYLVWACLIYAIVGTWIAHKIGFPLSKLNFIQQKFEADFRYLLMRLRENSESIALEGGEAFEKQKLLSKFSQIVGNFRELIRRQKKLLLTTNVYGQFAYIFPFVVASPEVFTKQITLGQLFQISSAFGQVQGSMSVFVDMYAKLMRLNSVALRLGGFLISLNEMKSQHSPVLSISMAAQALTIRNLRVRTPQGSELFGSFNFQSQSGERILLIGASGKGKSTLVKAMNGLWPFAEGSIELSSLPVLILPQKPYLPIGKLSEAITYPANDQKFTREELREALSKAMLSQFESSLEEHDDWSQRLSAGEQQRLCFARIFVHKPKVLFLDEATSAVEKGLERKLFEKLIETLPQLTLLTFTHDSESLSEFHHRIVQLN